MSAHPVLTLINRCDALAQQFDSTFESSCVLLRNLADGTPAPGSPTTMDDTLMALRETLGRCEEVVGAMLGCVYEDIPHLLDQQDQGERGGIVGSWDPKGALESISTLFYVSTATPIWKHLPPLLTSSSPCSPVPPRPRTSCSPSYLVLLPPLAPLPPKPSSTPLPPSNVI